MTSVLEQRHPTPPDVERGVMGGQRKPVPGCKVDAFAEADRLLAIELYAEHEHVLMSRDVLISHSRRSEDTHQQCCGCDDDNEALHTVSLLNTRADGGGPVRARP